MKYVFLKKIWRTCLSLKGNQNQIEPENQLQNGEPQSALNAD